MTVIKRLLVTVFGLGLMPIAPGTWGSFGAALIFLAYAYPLGADQAGTAWLVTAILVIAGSVVGVALGKWAVRHFLMKDPSPFVLDEAAGMWLALLWIPYAGPLSLIIVAVSQFLLFRIADIVKPFPSRQSEALPFGWGIVVDDLFAAVYANLIGQAIFRILVPWLLHGPGQTPVGGV
ncbi:MAG: phosphatidylglycerophosphatase A [Phycisphaerae bacterium]|nr:phosphatidylglycerophosphatase A [Phycisphaerae bacterium]